MRVKIKGFDPKVVEKSANVVLEAAFNTGSKVKGPYFYLQIVEYIVC